MFTLTGQKALVSAANMTGIKKNKPMMMLYDKSVQENPGIRTERTD